MPAEGDPAMDGRDGSPQQFCLRWNNYKNNLTSSFDQLLQTQSFVDVTLACDGQSLKAHKVVLSACSPYFEQLLMENPCQHPIIIIRDVQFGDLRAAVDFMYRGEINVAQDRIASLLKVADTLRIRGLTDVSNEYAAMSEERSSGGTSRGRKRSASPGAGSSPCGAPATTRPCRRTSPAEHASPLGSGTAADGSPPRSEPTTPLTDAPPPAPGTPHHEDIDIRPGIAEMIREEERARMLENSQAWMGASTSSSALAGQLEFPGHTVNVKMKAPRWTDAQLQEAIQAVVTQRMRFTQAAFFYAIPKGTLYDNILGKSKRMAVLDDAALTSSEERAVLEFCCETSVSPYNRRTKKSLREVLAFVEKLRRARDPEFAFVGLTGFRWWWAFCKKHSIVSLYYEGSTKTKFERIVNVKIKKENVNAETYQYRMQSLWQQCWSTNQNMVHNLRLRERGPLKSWRPETMAEAIFSVLKEGLSLSQAARKYDIPYPTFVLYANRVHNMLGPSADGGADLRPKGRGRPQRILLGSWPDNHIRGVIRAVVFRENHSAPHTPQHHLREMDMPVYPAITDGTNAGTAGGNGCGGDGREGHVSPNAAAAAAVAAVAHNLRRSMCNMVVAAQRPADHGVHVSLPSLPLHSPRLASPLTAGLESPLCSPPPPPGHEPARPADPFRPFAEPPPERHMPAPPHEMGPPETPVSRNNGQGASPLEAGSPPVI